MTHQYDQMNPSDALYIAARQYPGGIEALASRLGMSAAVLYNKLSPRSSNNIIGFDESCMILDYLAEVGRDDLVEMVINAYCWRHNHMTMKLPEHAPGDDRLLPQVLDILTTPGKLADGLRGALEDDVINARELAQLEQEFHTCLQTLIKLRNTVHGKAGQSHVK